MSTRHLLITSFKHYNSIIRCCRENVHYAVCYRYCLSQPIFYEKLRRDVIKSRVKNKTVMDPDERSGFPRVSTNSDFNRYFTNKMRFYYVTIATV